MKERAPCADRLMGLEDEGSRDEAGDMGGAQEKAPNRAVTPPGFPLSSSLGAARLARWPGASLCFLTCEMGSVRPGLSRIAERWGPAAGGPGPGHLALLSVQGCSASLPAQQGPEPWQEVEPPVSEPSSELAGPRAFWTVCTPPSDLWSHLGGRRMALINDAV